MTTQPFPKTEITLSDILSDEFWRLNKLTVALITLLDTIAGDHELELEKGFLHTLHFHLKDLGREIKAEQDKAFSKLLDKSVSPGNCWGTLLQLAEKA